MMNVETPFGLELGPKATRQPGNEATRHRGRGARRAIMLAAAALLMAAGCETTPHQQHRDQAQRHWNQVRAKIKCQLATQQFESGAVDAAIATVRESLGLDPMAPESHLLLARALMEAGNVAEAGRTLAAARAMDLQSAPMTYAAGVVAERALDLDQALAFYQQACQQDPDQMDYVVAQVECLVAVGRPEEALEIVRESIERFDRDGTLDVLEAEVSLVLGDDRAAARAFRRSLPLIGNDPLVVEEYGLLLARMERFGEAVAVLQPLAETLAGTGQEPSGSVVHALAQSYIEVGHLEASGDLLADRLRKHPNDTEAWFLQGRVALAGGDLALAERCANAVRRQAPRGARTYLLCGYVRWRQGDASGALEALERSLSLQPHDVLLHCLMGQVLVEADQGERAKRHWLRALQIDPRSRWARNGLSELEAGRSGAGARG